MSKVLASSPSGGSHRDFRANPGGKLFITKRFKRAFVESCSQFISNSFCFRRRTKPASQTVSRQAFVSSNFHNWNESQRAFSLQLEIPWKIIIIFPFQFNPLSGSVEEDSRANIQRKLKVNSNKWKRKILRLSREWKKIFIQVGLVFQSAS